MCVRDLMIMRESGHGSIVGRIKDTIIRGGENVFPKEVEDFLYLNPLVMEAQVFGVPDEFMGEEVAAWVMLKEGVSLTEEQLRHFYHGKVSVIITHSFEKRILSQPLFYPHIFGIDFQIQDTTSYFLRVGIS